MPEIHASNGQTNALASLPIVLKDTRQKLSDFNEVALTFIKERPVTALFGALCLGFFLSRIASRR